MTTIEAPKAPAPRNPVGRPRPHSFSSPRPRRLRAPRRDQAWRGRSAAAAALGGMSFDELEHDRTVFSIVADEVRKPDGHDARWRRRDNIDTAMGCAVSSTLPGDTGVHDARAEYELRASDHDSHPRCVYAEGRVVHAGGRIATTGACLRRRRHSLRMPRQHA